MYMKVGVVSTVQLIKQENDIVIKGFPQRK